MPESMRSFISSNSGQHPMSRLSRSLAATEGCFFSFFSSTFPIVPASSYSFTALCSGQSSWHSMISWASLDTQPFFALGSEVVLPEAWRSFISSFSGQQLSMIFFMASICELETLPRIVGFLAEQGQFSISASLSPSDSNSESLSRSESISLSDSDSESTLFSDSISPSDSDSDSFSLPLSLES